MKRLVAALALLCLSAGSTEALPFVPSVGISYPVPKNQFTDVVDGQWGISATFGILPTPIVKTGLEVGYWSFGQKSDVDTGGDVSVVVLAAVARVHIPGMDGRLKPYGRGGLGGFWMDTENAGNDTDFGYLIGAGVDYGLAPTVTLFLDISYYDANIDFVPITLGVRF